MAVATLKESVITGTVRRFELPDLYQHGGWIKTRLLTKFPHLNEVSIIGWLKSALYDHSSLFLYQEHSVALAQTLKLHTLEPAPVVHERFVWCKDPKDPDYKAARLLPSIRLKSISTRMPSGRNSFLISRSISCGNSK